MSKKKKADDTKALTPDIVITNWASETVCLSLPTAGEQPATHTIGAYRIDRVSLRDDGPADNVTDIKTPHWLRCLLAQAFDHGMQCERTRMRRTLGL